jgi:hypothetical protein
MTRDPCLWVGIDEAGYGPNLGPLVMTAVCAVGPGDSPPDVWNDLSRTVDRAGGRADRLWIDDSKRVLACAGGFERLEASVLAALAAVEPGAAGSWPRDLSQGLHALGAGTLGDVELARWLEGAPPRIPRGGNGAAPAHSALAGASWRLVAIRSVVLGPERFNARLAELGNKAEVHFDLFRQLLDPLWRTGAERCARARVVADKHGGRHYYLPRLQRAWPEVWIERGLEGPELSRYVFHASHRRLELRLMPRGDSCDGLVALASLASKYLRERWMEVFNAFWRKRLPGLAPTAGYPTDAKRFRDAIEPHCRALGLDESVWWRRR